MKWIRSSDALPERVPNTRYSQVPCLVWCEDEVQVLVFNHEHMVWDDRSGDDFYCNICEVPYWMPLPSPPTADAMEDANLQHTTGASSPLETA